VDKNEPSNEASQKTPPAESAVDENGAKEKYNEGLDLYAKGKYVEAQRAWEQTLRLDPNHSKAKVALNNIKNK
jgi:TolA-binding protein